MNVKTLQQAIFEANRFLGRANEALKEMDTNKFYSFPKKTGAVRRSSLDLTRALADMRKTHF